MSKNFLQIISLSCMLVFACGCKMTPKDIPNPVGLQFDTLFVGPQAYGKTPHGEPLSDSIAEIYRAKSFQFEPFPTLINFDEPPYKAFQQAFIRLDKTTIGKVIHFEPEGNTYSSSQFFLEKNDGTLEDVVELAYSYGEEGMMGDGSSYIIQGDSGIKIFTTKYWVVFEYYNHDEREDSDLVLDTLMAFEYKRQSLVPIQLDSINKVQIAVMFE